MHVFAAGGSGLTRPAVVAELVADRLGLPAADNPVSGDRTRALLGWTPTRPTSLADIGHGDCCAPREPDPSRTEETR